MSFQGSLGAADTSVCATPACDNPQPLSLMYTLDRRRYRLFSIGNRRIAREDIRDLADVEQVPNAVVKPCQQQTPVTPFKGNVHPNQHSEAARIHVTDAAHVDDQGARLITAHQIAETKRGVGVQHTVKRNDLLVRT